MYQYTCDICGQQFEDEEKDGVIQIAQHHLQTDHNLQKESDVTEPNLAYEQDELEERIEEIE